MKTKQSKMKQGIIIEPVAGLNYGQTVDVIGEDGDCWVILPHGDVKKHLLLKHYVKVEKYS